MIFSEIEMGKDCPYRISCGASWEVSHGVGADRVRVTFSIAQGIAIACPCPEKERRERYARHSIGTFLGLHITTFFGEFTSEIPSQTTSLGPDLRIQSTYTCVNNSEDHQF